MCAFSAVVRAHTADVVDTVCEVAHITVAAAPVFGAAPAGANITVHGQCTSNQAIAYVSYSVAVNGSNRIILVADLAGLSDARYFTLAVTEFETTLLV